MSLHFEQYRQKAIRFIKKIAKELNTDDLAYADRVVTTFLLTLRETISTEESFKLIEILPMHFKGIYIHGWKLTDNRPVWTFQQFLKAVSNKLIKGNAVQMQDVSLRAVKTVLKSLMNEHMRSRSAVDIPTNLPQLLLPLWDELRDLSHPFIAPEALELKELQPVGISEAAVISEKITLN